MVDKVYLIKKVPKPRVANEDYPRIRTTRDVFNQVSELAAETNQPISKVTAKLISFSLKHVEIIEESEEEDHANY